MRPAFAMLSMPMLMGCAGELISDPTSDIVETPRDSSRADDHKIRGVVPVGRVFGIANDFSGKLSEEEEKTVPEPLRGAFYVESLKQIKTTELEKELQFKTLVAEENRGGRRFVALKDFRHVQFSDEVSGQMIVIERYLVIPNGPRKTSEVRLRGN